ncbi:MAG: SGNH/GDSL hydrolase family protein [Jatrophihabitans sp.]|nr:MAG: SGNH/GDSL hydrolase family protein [Jatrophihabitans sp.]
MPATYRRALVAATVLALAATGAVVSYAAVHRTDSVAGVAHIARVAPAAGRLPVAAGSRIAPDESPGPAPRRVPLLAPGARILFVGASYTAGLGANPATDGYAYLVGRYLHRPVSIDAVPGSGFVNPGPRDGGTFAERIARLPASLDPGLVVLQGGRNDAGCSRLRLWRAALQTVELARHRFRHARLAFLGPVPGRLPVHRSVREVEAVLQEVARDQNVIFIDAIAQGWITRQNVAGFAGPVPDHPNNAGYAFIARRVADDLAAALDLPGLNIGTGPSM